MSAVPQDGRRHKSGVVYLSRVPRFMGPGEVKQYFAARGFAVERIFFVPEPAAKREARRRRGGDMRRPLFVEGWLEFVRKRDAKLAAETLNGQPVGGERSYRNDMWALRYLRGFKFAHLQEEKVYEAAKHKKEVRERLDEAKQDTKAYLERVAQAKRAEFIRERKRQRGEEVVAPKLPLVRQQVPLASSTHVSDSLKQKILGNTTATNTTESNDKKDSAPTENTATKKQKKDPKPKQKAPGSDKKNKQTNKKKTKAASANFSFSF